MFTTICLVLFCLIVLRMTVGILQGLLEFISDLFWHAVSSLNEVMLEGQIAHTDTVEELERVFKAIYKIPKCRCRKGYRQEHRSCTCVDKNLLSEHALRKIFSLKRRAEQLATQG